MQHPKWFLTVEPWPRAITGLDYGRCAVAWLPVLHWKVTNQILVAEQEV